MHRRKRVWLRQPLPLRAAFRGLCHRPCTQQHWETRLNRVRDFQLSNLENNRPHFPSSRSAIISVEQTTRKSAPARPAQGKHRWERKPWGPGAVPALLCSVPIGRPPSALEPAHCSLTQRRTVCGPCCSQESSCLIVFSILTPRGPSTPSLTSAGSCSQLCRGLWIEPPFSGAACSGPTRAHHNQAGKLGCRQGDGERTLPRTRHKCSPAFPRPP